MEKKDKNKKIISLSIVLFIVMLLVSGGSYAYWTWITNTSEQTNVALTITAPDMTATLTGYTQTVSNLIPVSSCTDSTYAIKKELTLTYENLSTNTGMITGTLSIDNFISPNGTPDSDDLSHLHYAVTRSGDSCTSSPVTGMSGTFTTTSGNLFTDTKLMNVIPSGAAETSSTYYLWLWLDSEYTHQNVGSGVTNDPMQNISFNLVWTGAIYNDLTQPEVPVLDEGMIPVTIANDGTVTTIAKDDEEWYDYSNKEWANVVLVNESATADVEGSQSRSYYQSNLGNNVEVNQSDILAYYVWIPRYKYKIWDVTKTSTPQTIDIEFETETAEAILGTTVNSWRTHPAFIWDGETIAGIWVGKFETSTETTSTCYTTPSRDNCNNTNQSPRILPNVKSLIWQNISNQFQTSLKFAGGTLSDGIVTFAGSSTYGLTANVDSHMMKNREWGAVAYLSHSQYGINYEIRINNNSIYTTGCGASEENGAKSTSCEIAYGGATSYPQSTTGNITGVFDMSGGAYEYVMGVFANSSGSLWTGYSSDSNSGFNGLYRSSGTGYTSGINFPDEKYYDVYQATSGTTISSSTACNGGICYGHALSKVSGWYDDFQFFVNSYYPWFGLGGLFSDGAFAGAWSFGRSHGDAIDIGGFRSLAIVGA